MCYRKTGIGVLLLICSLCLFAEGPDWSSWRGPEANGIYNSSDWSYKSLAGDIEPLWKVYVGQGYSAVAVTAGRLYTMGNDKKSDTVFCFDSKTGKEIWKYSYPCDSGSYRGPRATPVVSGNRVYTVSRSGDVLALDAQSGKLIWKRNLMAHFKAGFPSWGFASSAVIEGNTLLLNANLYGVALDKRNGKTLWSSPKGTGSYASAVLYSRKGKSYALIFSSRALYSVEVATGKKLWEFPWVTDYDVNAADPVIVGDRVFITSGYGTGCALLDISGKTPKLVWKNKNMSSHFSSVIYLEGYIYGSSGDVGRRGYLSCLNFKTGELMWKQRTGTGALIASQGKLLYLAESGNLFVAEASPKGYIQLSKGRPLRAPFWSAPVLCKGKLYYRSNTGMLLALDVAPKGNK